MQRSLRDFSGAEPIFIDANIFLHHAFETNTASIEFLARVEAENIKAYTSALAMEEVIFKLIMQSASNFVERINVDKLKHFLSDDKNRKMVLGPVEKYMEYINALKDMGLRILDLTGKDIVNSVEKTKAHGLLTADAAHLAVMNRKGINHLASGDVDFDLNGHITLWMPI